MKREELEHVLRAASRIIDRPDLLVVGSAAILGTYDDDVLPHAASRSDEADLAPLDDPDGSLSARIEGSLGAGSMFHEQFGYFADGVSLETAIVGPGWRERLVLFDPPGAEPGRGWCLEAHDLAAAKLAAGRTKDYEFVAGLLDADLLDLDVLGQRFEQLPADRVIPGVGRRAERWLAARREAALRAISQDPAE
jgi:hypothetical protein